MKRMLAAFLTGLLTFSCGAFAVAEQPYSGESSEKPLIIKGIRLGMDINEARGKMVNLLGKDWKVSPVGKTVDLLADYRSGDPLIFYAPFDRDSSGLKLPGEWGFAIQDKKNYYSGYISADKSSLRVTRISFNGKITDYIFSASEIEVHHFVEEFKRHYNLPEFFWIVGGWTYKSPLGYTLTIRRDKLLDINLDIPVGTSDQKPKRPKFD